MLQPRTFTSIAVAALLVFAAVGAGPVAAQESSVVDDLLDGDDDGFIASAQAYASGFLDRVFTEDTGETAAEAAQNTQETFNGNNSTIQSWVNNRTSASDAYDVLRFTFEVDGETATVYLTSNATADGYRNATMVDSTSRTVDESCTLESHAAQQADTELAAFVDDYAEPNNNVSRSYLAGLAGSYGGSVDCTFDTETEE